jgi:hypothetical protein
MFVKKLLSAILLISLALLSGCAGMDVDGSEIKGQKAGTDK